MSVLSASPKVSFYFKDTSFYFPKRTALKQFLLSIFKKEGKKAGSVTYIFCGDEDLLQINRQFLKHDFYTDIISFDLSEDKGRIDAEIYISIDRVRENAAVRNLSFRNELHRVIFHGILHLCGYKDKSKKDQEKMRKKEDYYIQSYHK